MAAQHIRIFCITLGLLFAATTGFAQIDTVNVSLEEFIERGLDNSGQVEFERQKVRLAENRVDQARSRRILPTFELNTQHGVVPGVKSNTNLPDDELYLDPDLENDWNNWAIFTRAEVKGIQPIFAWGAFNSAMQAAKAGAVAAREQFQAARSVVEVRLYELYYSYLLASEVNHLLEEAQNKIDEIEQKIEERREEGSGELDESDYFKFKVFKSEFAIRAAEVRENTRFIEETWNYVLKADSNTTYLPEELFLDPVANKIQSLNFYQQQALAERSELKAADASIKAAKEGIDFTKSQNLPMFFLGLTGSFADTPNRPRQDNPFIINNTNYASAAVGFGIRQNLNLFNIKSDIERSRIQYKQTQYLKDAVTDGIMLQINERYRNANLSEVKVEKTDEAWVTSKKWLRQEQLDYDFGMGDTKDLIDAMKKELELRVQLKREIFQFNKDMAELYNSAGLSVISLKTK
ncbi:MAG: TolC family protein [Balneolaceae bacterium]|nr:TolC family protein [Balneolaceae bacterium]